MSTLEHEHDRNHPPPADTQTHGHIRSYVLRQGRVSNAQQRHHDEGMPRWGVPYRAELLDLTTVFGRPSAHAPKILEIGFGMGETTARIAADHPENDYLGLEVHTPGVGSLLKEITERGLNNLRICQHDAVEVLRDMIPLASLSGVHVFFPDPWPKKRQQKRWCTCWRNACFRAHICIARLTGKNMPCRWLRCSPPSRYWKTPAPCPAALLRARPIGHKPSSKHAACVSGMGSGMSCSAARRAEMRAGQQTLRTLKTLRALLYDFLGCWLLAGCATLSGGSRQVSLGSRFPLDKRVLEMFHIQLTRPQLSTLPEQERLLITLGMAVSTPLTVQPWNGRLALSGKLFIDAAQNAIVMRDVRVEKLSADGMDEARQRLLGKVMDLVTDQVLQDSPLYRFKPDELRYFGTQYVPIAIHPVSDALRLTFEPARPAHQLR